MHRLQANETDGFYYFTDTHTSSNILKIGYVIDSLCTQTSPRTIIWGGDAISAYSCDGNDCRSSILLEWNRQKTIHSKLQKKYPFYCVHGNHDFTVKSSPKEDGGYTFGMAETRDMLFGEITGSFVRNESDQNGCYYYFDSHKSKIRFIVLDTNDSCREGNVPWGTCFTVGQVQIDWIFRQAVPSVPKGYDIIFISHVPLADTTCNTPGFYRHLLGAIEALANHTKYDDFDFTSLTDTRVLMVLSGHMHQDLQTFRNGVLHVVTASDAYYQDYLSSPFFENAPLRSTSSTYANVCDYVSINLKRSAVSFVRIGAGFSRTFNLTTNRINVGQRIRLKTRDENTVTWRSYDSSGNKYENSKWNLSQSVVSVEADGTIVGLQPGESTVVAIDDTGNKEFYYVQVTSQSKESGIYISSSIGVDTNQGTKEYPLKTIGEAFRRYPHDTKVYLRCGDVFLERISDLESCTIESYGNGRKPILCGFRVLKNISSWESVDSCLWRLDLMKDDNFSGFYESAMSNAHRWGNIGVLYIPDSDRIYGNMVNDETKLKKDYDFMVLRDQNGSSYSDDSFKYLYLYSKQHPKALGNLCFSVGENAISNIKNCTIKNIAIIGFGKHGIVNLDNCTIENCDLDIIGGSVLLGFKYWVRYGNGVEISAGGSNPNCNNGIYNCQITRTYDTATTIQGSGAGMKSNSNNHFRNNRIAYCRQAFERYINSTDTDPEYIDCDFSNNLCYMNGDNMFGIPSNFNDCQLLSYEKKVRPFVIENNTFYGGNYFCGRHFAPGTSNNIVYLYPDNYINFTIEAKSEPKALAALNNINSYRESAEDSSKIVVIERDSKQDRKLKKRLLKKLHLIKYRLTSKELLHNETVIK